LNAQVQFRMIDGGSNASTGTVVGYTADGNDAGIKQNIIMSHIFTFTAAAQTVRLQKRITTATNIGTHQLLGTTGSFGLYMSAEKI